MEAPGLAHLLHFPLPESLSNHCTRWKTHKPNQGNRYERHKQLYQTSCNYLLHLLDTHRRERCRAFPGGPSGDTKTYYQSNFPLSQRGKQSARGAPCIIHPSSDRARGEHRTPNEEWESRLRGADVASFHNLFCLINNVAWNQWVSVLPHLSISHATGIRKKKERKKRNKSILSNWAATYWLLPLHEFCMFPFDFMKFKMLLNSETSECIFQSHKAANLWRLSSCNWSAEIKSILMFVLDTETSSAL